MSRPPLLSWRPRDSLASTVCWENSARPANTRAEGHIMGQHVARVQGPLHAVEMFYRRKPDVFLGPVCPYVLAPVVR